MALARDYGGKMKNAFGHVQMVYFLWQMGVVDTQGLANCFINIGIQYGTMVFAKSVAGVKALDNNATMFREPLDGLLVAHQFIKVAPNAAEKRLRVATLAACLSTSILNIFVGDVPTNAAAAGAASVQIASMRAVLEARGGGIRHYLHSEFFLRYCYGINLKFNYSNYKIIYHTIKKPITEISFHPYRIKFAENSRGIIANFLSERKNHYSLTHVESLPRYVVPVVTTTVYSTSFVFIVSASLTFGLLISIIGGGLCLFQKSKSNRYKITQIDVNSLQSAND